MAYTPTTWVTGDTVTATKMNKIENGIANAGGGGLVHYTVTSGTLDCTYNDLLADITAGRLPYISNSSANIAYGLLAQLDTRNDYQAWFLTNNGASSVFYSESADSYLTSD